MTGMRFVATALLALILCLSGHSAFAQFQRAAPAQGRPPVAAPTGAPAEAAPLAAPAGTIDTNLVGSRSEIVEAFTPVGLFLRADIVVKCVLALLILASFWSWVLIIDKWIAFGTLKRKAKALRERPSGRAVRWTSFTPNIPSARISPSRRCSLRLCANGNAPSRAGRRARRSSPASRTAWKRR